MRSAGVYLVVAIGVGLALAATALYIIRPQDMPIAMPGTQDVSMLGSTSAMPTAQEESQPVAVPPVILRMGPSTSEQTLHLVLSGLDEDNKNAYRAARALQQANPNIALNIVPAIDAGSPTRLAFAWALAASDHPDQQDGFIDGLMGSSGDINTSVLTLLAQNNGLDATHLGQQAESTEVQQALAQANNVLPPSLPAIQANGQWLTAAELNSSVLGSVMGQSADHAGDMRLVVSDAYAYATAPSATTAAIFLSARNVGTANAVITGVSTNVSARAEIHSMATDDKGVMQMRKENKVDVAAGATTSFTPHGLHIMLFDLPAPLAVGQKFPLTLILQGGSEISTFVTVTKPGQVLTNHHHSG